MTDPAPRNRQGFEESVREDVEDAGRERADAEGEEHVSQLGHGGVGQHALDVVLHQADGGGKERGERADDRHGLHRPGASTNNAFERATIYTPAVTMVAAWIRAETGVGPSMASGSQT